MLNGTNFGTNFYNKPSKYLHSLDMTKKNEYSFIKHLYIPNILVNIISIYYIVFFYNIPHSLNIILCLIIVSK